MSLHLSDLTIITAAEWEQKSTDYNNTETMGLD